MQKAVLKHSRESAAPCQPRSKQTNTHKPNTTSAYLLPLFHHFCLIADFFLFLSLLVDVQTHTVHLHKHSLALYLSSSSSSPLTSQPQSLQSTVCVNSSVCRGGTLGITAIGSSTCRTEWAEEAHSSLEL